MTFHLRPTRSCLYVIMPMLLFLGACAVPTPYQPATNGFGYTEQQIENNRFRVSFDGNSSTPRETVQNYLLYRAAELTVQKGYDYFTVVDRDLERSTRYYNHSYYDSFGYFSRNGRLDRRYLFGPTYASGTSYPIDRYSSSADILMFKGEKPADDVRAYDALDVLQRLQPTILRSGS